MSRERITSEAEVAGLLLAVESLEKAAGIQAADDKVVDDAKKEKDPKVAVDGAGIVSEADAAAKQDIKTVNESVPAGKAEVKDQGNQNAKAEKNWPVAEADKFKVARKLITLAKDLLSE